MPHAVRGVHAFRPSQQTHGAIANTTFTGAGGSAVVADSGGSTAAAAAAEAMGPPPRTNNEPDSSDDEVGIPPTTPIRPSSTISSTTTSKRRHSALEDDTSSTSYSKRSRNSTTSGASALHGIKDVMADINMSMRNGSMGQPRTHRRSSAERRIEATTLLQEREDLTADQAIAFADLFEQDTAKADTYMGLVRIDVRKLWVQRQLVKLGFPTIGSGEAEV
jgi:hypothetical protein